MSGLQQSITAYGRHTDGRKCDNSKCQLHFVTAAQLNDAKLCGHKRKCNQSLYAQNVCNGTTHGRKNAHTVSYCGGVGGALFRRVRYKFVSES